tara:strand:- start:217 stop:537 length:321 start_codon:yes stop_codon:yes gene_type:complete
MAVTKTLVKAIPHEKSSKVEEWHLSMKYENDSEGDSTYYTSTFLTVAVAANGDFTKAAKDTFNLAALTAMFNTTKWDAVFTSQVDSVITNPVVNAEPDNDFAVPSS